MNNVVILMALVLVLLASVIVLQIFLSKREGKWPGRILPLLSLLGSLVYPLNMIAPAEGVSAGFAVQLLLVFLLANIPTAVLSAIYFACREKQRTKKQLDKMSAQDLT